MNNKLTEVKSKIKNENILEYINSCKIDDCAEIFPDNLAGIIVDGINEGKRDLMLILKRNIILFRDDVATPERLETCYGISTDVTTPIYNKLLEDVKQYNAEFEKSDCGGNDDYDWMDLIFKINDFTKDKLIECVKLWDEYNEYMRRYEK